MDKLKILEHLRIILAGIIVGLLLTTIDEAIIEAISPYRGFLGLFVFVIVAGFLAGTIDALSRSSKTRDTK